MAMKKASSLNFGGEDTYVFAPKWKDIQDKPEVTNGQDGEDGVSPTISVEEITGGHRLTITDNDGTKTVDVMDGKDGTQGGGGAQLDWSAKEGEAGHILNRTHYYEETVLLEETPLTFEYNDELGMACAMLESNIGFVFGTDYIVIYNGKEYVCSLPTVNTSAIGNTGAFEGGNDSGEPFVIIGVDGALVVIPTEDIQTATVSLTQRSVVPIPAKFLPDIEIFDLSAAGINICDLADREEQFTALNFPGLTGIYNFAIKAYKRGSARVRTKYMPIAGNAAAMRDFAVSVDASLPDGTTIDGIYLSFFCESENQQGDNSVIQFDHVVISVSTADSIRIRLI